VTPRAQDPRTLRTVTALRGALRGALGDSTLDQVSVSGICRRAEVRRTTFYTHYASVAELLTEMLTGELDEQLGREGDSRMSVADVSEMFRGSLRSVFEIVTADRHLFRVGFESDASALLRRALSSMLVRRVEGAIAVWRDHGVALDVDLHIAAPFAAGGLTAAIELWAHGDDTDSACWADTVHDQMAPWWPRG
jgi:AcrR family transcriptional regulator